MSDHCKGFTGMEGWKRQRERKKTDVAREVEG